MSQTLSSPPTRPPKLGRSDLRTVSLPFTDARTCKDWLKAIPLTNAGQAQRLMLEAVRNLNRADFLPLERLTCLELMRDKVSFVQAEQRSRYWGKTVPLVSADMAVWETSRQLVEEMEAGYRKCFELVGQGDTSVEPHLALIIQRTMRYIGLQMLFAGILYRRFDPGLWMRLHLQWIEAESRGLVLTKVKDSVGSIDGVSTVTAAYVAILLAQQARTHELGTRQMDFLDAILKRFAAKVTVSLAPVSARPGHLLSVDLFTNAGASTDPGARESDHVRFLDVTALSKSLRARVVKLQEGESPATLSLPTDWPIGEMTTQLRRLHKLWCEPVPMLPPGIVPSQTHAIVCFGLDQFHYFLTGAPFEQPGRKRELSRQELNDIAMFGKVSEQTMKSLYVEVKFATESWGIIEETRGALKLMRPANSAQGLAVGRLMGVRLGVQSPWMVAMVSAILAEADGSHHATLTLLPGAPAPVAVRPADQRNRAGAQYVPALTLPAIPALSVEETVLIPANLAPPGRGVDIALNGQSQGKEITVHEVIERGVDFERVTFF
jgi:cyclic-di-GMP-binding protein